MPNINIYILLIGIRNLLLYTMLLYFKDDVTIKHMYSILLKIFNVGVNFSCIYQTPWSRSAQHHHQHDQSPHSKEEREKKQLGLTGTQCFFFLFLVIGFCFLCGFFFFGIKWKANPTYSLVKSNIKGKAGSMDDVGLFWSIDNIVLMMSRGRKS